MKDVPPRVCCVVCGSLDARSLTTTMLADGSMVDVCGSHALSHVRAGRVAKSVAELALLTADRRDGGDRRAGAEDELAKMLGEAFAPRPLRGGPRRKADRPS